MPFLDFWLDKNPVKRIGPPNLGNITGIAFGHLMARLEGKDENFNPAFPDFLQRFIDAKKSHPDVVDEGIIMGYLLVNLLAGADTTAITVRAAFYYLLKNPSAYRKLVEEIRAAGFGEVVPYDAARQLPCNYCVHPTTQATANTYSWQISKPSFARRCESTLAYACSWNATFPSRASRSLAESTYRPV
jgi:hypothetical protein